MKTVRPLLVALFLTSRFLSLNALAEMPVVRMDSVFPPGAQSGKETELVISVADGAPIDALRFSNPGITAVLKEKNRFTVNIAADVKPGLYEAVASGSQGISNPRAFLVDPLPQSVLTKSGASAKDAIPLQIGAAFWGKITAATADYFKVPMRKDQRLVLRCDVESIDSRLRPVWEVINASGRSLQTATRDGLLDVTAPADGECLLRLHDLTYSGGPEHLYRLSITEGPYVDFALPPVLQAGGRRKVTLYGRILPGAKLSAMRGSDGRPLEALETEVDAPQHAPSGSDGLRAISAAGTEVFAHRLTTPSGISNPVFFALSPNEAIQETEPNNDAAHARTFTTPAVLSGQFYPKNDVDTWSFEAKKGDVWRVDVTSQRLGLRTNPHLLIQKDGKDVTEAWGPETDPATRLFPAPLNDPSVRLEVKEDGVYTIFVRDLSGGIRVDPRAVYTLSVRKEAPDFSLLAFLQPPLETPTSTTLTPTAPILRAGGTLAIRVRVLRKDSFTGAIELEALDLPDGVTCVPTTILAGKSEGHVILSAKEGVAPFTGAIKIVGRATLATGTLERTAQPAGTQWMVPTINNGDVTPYLIKECVLGVLASESAPLAIAPMSEVPAEVVVGGKLEFTMQVTRRGEFREALKLKAAGALGVETLKDVDAEAKAQEVKVTLDTAALKLPAGNHSVYFTALTKGKFRGKDVTTTVYSTPLSFTVKAPEPAPR